MFGIGRRILTGSSPPESLPAFGTVRRESWSPNELRKSNASQIDVFSDSSIHINSIHFRSTHSLYIHCHVFNSGS